MATYAIGDIQGCYDEFQALLKLINFDPNEDKLWLLGDLVGRGPKALEVMTFILKNSKAIECVLGNHDLHAYACYLGTQKADPKDKFDALLDSKLSDEIFKWLRQQKLFHYDENLNTAMVHAGVHPSWTLEQCLSLAKEVQDVLKSDQVEQFIIHMYGDKPNIWDVNLAGNERLRFLVNIMTRVRLFKGPQLELELKVKESIDLEKTKSDLSPWFELTTLNRNINIVFGHWAALEGVVNVPNIFAMDTGCVWGGSLSAIRLEDKQRFLIPAMRGSI